MLQFAACVELWPLFRIITSGADAHDLLTENIVSFVQERLSAIKEGGDDE